MRPWRRCLLAAALALACVDLTPPDGANVSVGEPDAAAPDAPLDVDGAVPGTAPDVPVEALPDREPDGVPGPAPDAPDAASPDQPTIPDAPSPDAPVDAPPPPPDAPPPPPDAPPPPPDTRPPDMGPTPGAGTALYWKLDEESGSVAADSSGNAFHGTFGGSNGIPASSTSVADLQFPNPRSRQFTASSRHQVRLAPMPAEIRPSSALTISAWFRATSIDVGGYSEIVNGGNGYVIYLSRSEVTFTKQINASTQAGAYCTISTSRALDGQWHHVAAVNDLTGMRLYFDGPVACTNNRTEPIVYNAGPEFLVGRDNVASEDWYWNGHIDEVRVYTHVLSAAEIASLAAGEP
jgi:hypothetical protein